MEFSNWGTLVIGNIAEDICDLNVSKHVSINFPAFQISYFAKHRGHLERDLVASHKILSKSHQLCSEIGYTEV